MKGIVAYDGVHENNNMVAEAIAEEIRASGHEVVLIDIDRLNPYERWVGSDIIMKRILKNGKGAEWPF